MSDSIEISPEEASQNVYQVFHFTLQALASEPEEQCEMMGDYNTAWELRDDGLAGHYLIGSGLFNADQQTAVLEFLAAIDSVPVHKMPYGAGREVNLAAMHHEAWEPVRILAQRLLLTLDPITQANEKYFQSSGTAP